MELRHLRYFLALAEEQNFTRAAGRLHISQPPLSRQIKALEDDLGVTLIERSGHRSELTPAGKVFAEEARRILADVHRAVRLTRQAARGITGTIRIGFTESASFNALVPRTFQTFRSSYPGVEVALEEHKSTELSQALLEDQLDAAFLRPPIPRGTGIELHLLDAEEMVVAMPADHILAARKDVSLQELASETFIFYPRTIRPGLIDAVVEACRQAGFEPQVAQSAPQLSSTINLVAAGLGISIVPRSMERLQPQAVRYVPLRDNPIRAYLGIAHRLKESSPAVMNFVQTARSIAAHTSAAGLRA